MILRFANLATELATSKRIHSREIVSTTQSDEAVGLLYHNLLGK